MTTSNDDLEIEPAKSPPSLSPDELLPPVEAPNAGFILQLFLVPMMIVTAVVVVVLLFNWLAHMGTGPEQIIKQLEASSSDRFNPGEWQKAVTLANMLNSPRYAALKRDATQAERLARVLLRQLDDGGMDEDQIDLRYFLCQAVGQFQVSESIAVLIEAARLERDAREIKVRRAAIHAVARLAEHVDVRSLQENKELISTLGAAATERSSDRLDETRQRARLRYSAAFALGVIGGRKSLDHLAAMLDDPDPNARYNAAGGLARHGDDRGVSVLVEMLEPDNEEAVKFEEEEEESARLRKRGDVFRNALRAAGELARKNDSADLTSLAEAVERLRNADVPALIRHRVRLDTTDVLKTLESRVDTAPAVR